MVDFVFQGEFKDRLCEVCCRSFATVSNLNAHMKTHSEEKAYPCTECDRAFKWSSSLLTHMQSAHGLATPQLKVITQLI